MKRILTILILVGLCSACSALAASKTSTIVLPENIDRAEVKSAVDQLAAKVVTEFMDERKGESYRSFAVMPLVPDLDGGYGTVRLMDEMASQGRGPGYDIYTRENAALNEVLEEIVFGQNFEDAINADTIQKLGNAVNAEVVVLNRLDVTSADDGTTTVELNLSAYVTETFRSLGGANERMVVDPKKTWLAKALPWIIGIVVLLIVRVFFKAIGKARRPR